MPAGDLIVADYQFELREHLAGDGCDWDNTEQGWSDPTGGEVVGSDAQRTLADGVSAGFDRSGPIVFTASLWTPNCYDDAEAWDLVSELREAWAPSGYADLELHMQLPGLGHCWLLGRPRGVQVDTARIREGVAFAMVTFLGVDGRLHFPDEGGSA